MNVRTPRFYTDYINYFLSRGSTQDGNFDVQPTSVNGLSIIGLQNGTEAELFDMKPTNTVDFNTSADPDGHVIISLDLKASYKKSFIAILNHNLNTADGKIRISASNTEAHVQAADFGSATAITCTEVVNAGSISTNIITPATDGSTIVRFTESDLRYWGIQFEGNGGNEFSATDLYVGCILAGEYYEMPHAPDMAIKRSIIFDQVKVMESVGGQRFSNMSNIGRQAESGSISPFSTSIHAARIHGGRITYDMNFSYLNSTDVMPNEYDIYEIADDAVVEDVWNKTNGRHLPFIFSVDKDSEGNNAESEHIFARFGQDSLDMTQVANDMWNINMRIEEEF